MTTASTLAPRSDVGEALTDVSWVAHCTLWVAPAAVGALTSIGVWVFLQGFALIDRLTLGTLGGLPPPVGWVATALIPAAGGLLVAVGMHTLSRPARLAAMAHVIDAVAAGGGRLDLRNGAAFVVNSQIGIGRTFVIPTLIAVVASTLVTSAVGGQPARYPTPAGAETWGPALLVYGGAAVVSALAAIGYVNLLPITRGVWTRVQLPNWAKPAIAGLLVGVVGIWLPDLRDRVGFLVPLTMGAAIAYGLARFFQPGFAYTFGFGPMGLKFVPGTYTEVRIES